jgi:hypothetical protein
MDRLISARRQGRTLNSTARLTRLIPMTIEMIVVIMAVSPIIGIEVLDLGLLATGLWAALVAR